MQVEEERRTKEWLLTVKLRTHTETAQARNGRQKIELILDVNKAGQGEGAVEQTASCGLAPSNLLGVKRRNF